MRNARLPVAALAAAVLLAAAAAAAQNSTGTTAAAATTATTTATNTATTSVAATTAAAAATTGSGGGGGGPLPPTAPPAQVVQACTDCATAAGDRWCLFSRVCAVGAAQQCPRGAAEEVAFGTTCGCLLFENATDPTAQDPCNACVAGPPASCRFCSDSTGNFSGRCVPSTVEASNPSGCSVGWRQVTQQCVPIVPCSALSQQGCSACSARVDCGFCSATAAAGNTTATSDACVGAGSTCPSGAPSADSPGECPAPPPSPPDSDDDGDTVTATGGLGDECCNLNHYILMAAGGCMILAGIGVAVFRYQKFGTVFGCDCD